MSVRFANKSVMGFGMSRRDFAGASSLGSVDWHITNTAAAIALLRRQGKTDGQIVTALQDDEEGQRLTSIIRGPDNVTINEAFEYLRTGKFPAGTECYSEQACRDQFRADPIKSGSSGAVPLLVAVGVAAGAAWFLFFRK